MKEFGSRLNGSVVYAPDKDSGGLPNPGHEAKKLQEIPVVFRDKQEKIVFRGDFKRLC